MLNAIKLKSTYAMCSFLAFVLLSSLVAFASGLSCYECDSLSDPRCGEYFCATGVARIDCEDAEVPSYLQPISRHGIRLPASGCITKFHEGVEGHRYFVRRSCYFGSLEYSAEACAAPDPYVVFADILMCEVCEGDLCNDHSGGGAVVAPLLLTLLLSGVLGIGWLRL